MNRYHDDPDVADARLARRLASDAGGLLLGLRRLGSTSPGQLRTDGDRLSHEMLTRELARVRPGDAVLSEEGEDDAARLALDRVWIIDPLDGTREFGEGRHDWAVHVALWCRGDLAAGAVALPGVDRILATDVPPPAPPDDGLDRPMRVAVSRTRPPAVVERLAAVMPVERVPMGSAGYKMMAVLTGEVDAYVHAGGQFEWDSAAPVAVARSAGLVTTRLDGSALAYNQSDPRLPDLVIAGGRWAGAVRQALDAVLEDSA